MQMRRRMQWSNITNQILIIFFFLIPIIVHGFNDEENNDGEEDEGYKVRLELVHRHDARFAKNGGADLDMVEAIKGFIHRDYIRRMRINQRWGFNHSISSHRRKDFETFQMSLHAGADYGLGEYFVRVGVGSPSQELWLLADTGNELTWFNCKDAPDTKKSDVRKHHKKSSKKKSKSRSRHKSRSKSKNKTKHQTRRKTETSVGAKTNPCKGVFCPKRSGSFEIVACSSEKCKIDLSNLFSLAECPRDSDPCQYDISYVDGSSAKGYFGTDTITVDITNGNKGKLHNLTIGCTKSMHNGLTFNEETGGILGLGYGKDSFVDKSVIEYGGKFSYCLMDHLSNKNVSNYLTFGTNNAKLLGEMKKTELLLLPPFYGVNITGISIGGQMLKIPPKVWDFDANGGVILDSGTTLTQLVKEAYEPVFEALTKSLTNVDMIFDDFGGLEFCFSSEKFNMSTVPRLVFHFAGGARFEPPVKSYIIDVAPDVKCIGIVSINGPGASVIGNIMQQNHLWEFDLAQNTVGFAPSTCT
ncbi:unnamed protein product [Lupinus luteus]|uniref:Peptidase A1 domain-containing protein n=1 Tax=Lupinus luteus TaxID=3873 RepID=A0AAV1XXK1_LUPLU